MAVARAWSPRCSNFNIRLSYHVSTSFNFSRIKNKTNRGQKPLPLPVPVQSSFCMERATIDDRSTIIDTIVGWNPTISCHIIANRSACFPYCIVKSRSCCASHQQSVTTTTPSYYGALLVAMLALQFTPVDGCFQRLYMSTSQMATLMLIFTEEKPMHCQKYK